MIETKLTSPSLRSIFILAFAQLNIGAAAIFVRLALFGTGPMNTALLRIALASVLVLLFARCRGVALRRTRQEIVRLVTAGCMLGAHFAVWIAAFRFTSVAVAMLLVSTTPFGLIVVETLRARRLPPLASRVAFPVAAAAIAVIIGGGGESAQIRHADPFAGAVLALVGAACIGVYLTLLRSIKNTRSTLSVVAITYPSALLVLLPLAIAAHEPAPSTAVSWAGILGMVCFSQILGHTALAASLKAFQPSTVAFATLAEPPIAAVLAALTLHETLTFPVIAGGVVLLAAIGVVLAQEKTS